jgi:acetyl-CoA C-acetyltransferase
MLGCGYHEAPTTGNIVRQASFCAGIPATAAGVTVRRFCASRQEVIAHTAKHIIVDRMLVVVSGRVESISLVD